IPGRRRGGGATYARGRRPAPPSGTSSPPGWPRARAPAPAVHARTSGTGAAPLPPGPSFLPDHPRFRDRHDEPSPAAAVLRLLLDDLVREVPGEDQEIVGLRLQDPLYRDDRDVRARRVEPVLEPAPVGEEVQERSVDPVVVQERVPLRRGPVAGQAPARAPELPEERDQPLPVGPHALAERRVRRRPEEPRVDLALEPLPDCRRHRAAGSRTLPANSHPAALDRDGLEP